MPTSASQSENECEKKNGCRRLCSGPFKQMIRSDVGKEFNSRLLSNGIDIKVTEQSSLEKV